MATAVAVIGLIVSMAGSGYAAYSSKQTSDFNEKMANQDAEYALQLGEVNAEDARRDYLRSKGEATVTVANSGADLLSSSVTAAMDESAAESAEEIAFIRMGATASARGSLIEAQDAKARGKAAVAGGVVNAGTTLTSNSGTVGSLFS